MTTKTKTKIPEVTARWEPGGTYGGGVGCDRLLPILGREHIHCAEGGRASSLICRRACPCCAAGSRLRNEWNGSLGSCASANRG